MDDLKHDLAAEKRGVQPSFFGKTLQVLSGISEGVDVVNLGTIWTIVNWIIYVIQPFILMYRVWQYSHIGYRNMKRGLRHKAKLQLRGTIRAGIFMGITFLKNIPVLDMIPFRKIAFGVEQWFIHRHVKKLDALLAAIRPTERKMKRLKSRARLPADQYEVAQIHVRVVGELEARFDAI